jgi:CDP-6-deoxy-D-xylo-4-hexulose-3-dehydrase
MDGTDDLKALEDQILKLVGDYWQAKESQKAFIPGQSKVQYAGSVTDAREWQNVVQATLRGWLGMADFGRRFEQLFRTYLGVKHCIPVNSGSSANLVALSSIGPRSRKLKLEDRLQEGDEVITVSAGFPTTINPILQNNLVPVFVDVQHENYNIDVSQLEAALSPKTRAVFVAHTLGIPAHVDEILQFCADAEKKLGRKVYYIEDCCDALGGTYKGRKLGTLGLFSTYSFYPAHQMTMGEGGAVATNSDLFAKIATSIRDWGRDCWCASDEKDPNGACGIRYNFPVKDRQGQVQRYNHRYVFSHVGYNLKPTEWQVAYGLAQLEKLPEFVEARRRNFQRLHDHFRKYEDQLILPKAPEGSQPCWFAFPLTIKDGAPFTREEFAAWLTRHHIESRTLFAGNAIDQPAYHAEPMRVIGDLPVSRKIMKDCIFLGVYPGLTPPMLDYVCQTVDAFFDQKVTGKA